MAERCASVGTGDTKAMYRIALTYSALMEYRGNDPSMLAELPYEEDMRALMHAAASTRSSPTIRADVETAPDPRGCECICQNLPAPYQVRDLACIPCTASANKT